MSIIPLEYIQGVYLFNLCGPSESVNTYGSFIFPFIQPMHQCLMITYLDVYDSIREYIKAIDLFNVCDPSECIDIHDSFIFLLIQKWSNYLMSVIYENT